MLKLNRKTEYALMILQFIRVRSSEELSSAKEICAKLHIPFDTTSKVMQILAQKDILQSTQGVRGGYKLTRDLDTLSYKQLIEIIEGAPLGLDCEKGECQMHSSCNISTPLKKFTHRMNNYLNEISVAELLQGELS